MHFDQLHTPENTESIILALKCSPLAYKMTVRHLLLSSLPLQHRQLLLAQQKSECKPILIPSSLSFPLNVNPPHYHRADRNPSVRDWDLLHVMDPSPGKIPTPDEKVLSRMKLY